MHAYSARARDRCHLVRTGVQMMASSTSIWARWSLQWLSRLRGYGGPAPGNDIDGRAHLFKPRGSSAARDQALSAVGAHDRSGA